LSPESAVCSQIKSEKGCITWAKADKQCKKQKGSKAKACQPGQTNPDATGTVTYNGQTYKVGNCLMAANLKVRHGSG
jgi:hypothetical protein